MRSSKDQQCWDARRFDNRSDSNKMTLIGFRNYLETDQAEARCSTLLLKQ
jgi:hypothetical protein